ncbi:MAG: class I SAM-dependent methyltransferase [Betaproteobacteria bacterium]
MVQLPEPTSEAKAHSERLCRRIRDEIEGDGGWMSFARFMELALYAPGLGYYAAGAQKFGAAGDFVTAPEMTPLFGQTLARQIAQVTAASAPFVLEAGAGSGRLAADLLLELGRLDALPERYVILELSGELRQRQHETIARAAPQALARVEWLDRLPQRYSGAIVANELLDAMPVHLVAWREAGIFERGVTVAGEFGFAWSERPANGALLAEAQKITEAWALPADYESEVALAAPRWAAEWGHILEQGAMLLIDYGFPHGEFYHPQRSGGTLMCHYRHQAHTDPFYLPGLQDITAHVDFTAIIATAHAAGLELYGFTTQGRFLTNCGLLACLAELSPGSPQYLRAAGAANRLILPQEMGELFKVMAIGRGIDCTLDGFGRGDQSHRL